MVIRRGILEGGPFNQSLFRGRGLGLTNAMEGMLKHRAGTSIPTIWFTNSQVLPQKDNIHKCLHCANAARLEVTEQGVIL